MGPSHKSVELTGFWWAITNSGVIALIALAISVAWLFVHRRRLDPVLPFAEFAGEHRSAFFLVFSRSTVIIVSAAISSAYLFGSEGMMNAVFNKMPNAYILYIFLFMAYDAFWKVVGQFNGEMH